jgi:DNA-binding transcriptional regulator GbsR (MarR family)
MVGHLRGHILMDSQDLFNAAITLSGAFGGWILKTIWDAIKDLKTEVKELNREVNQDFVRREDFKDSMADIKEMLNKIFDKLDNKADK